MPYLPRLAVHHRPTQLREEVQPSAVHQLPDEGGESQALPQGREVDGLFQEEPLLAPSPRIPRSRRGERRGEIYMYRCRGT